MPSDDNTVNINSREGRYHHGDLRSALIGEGLAELETKSPEQVSLREIARRAGVSATAVYRHFPDKAALLTALCKVGDERLGEAFRSAMARAEPGREAFRAMGQAYVRFALANPTLFRMMMTRPDPSAGPGGSDDTQAFASSILSDALKALMPPDATPAERRTKRIQAWAMVHGLAMLMLDGQVPAEDGLIDQVVDTSLL
ncbi:MAG: TetR/AcrR family transcriptional regulator [Hyphomonas sp.]|uniref:TetR/AcrR family transcriptional regulator n=1 Tax=Hyphomonas sp. TaxID=87 RepID=UPI003527EA6C